MNKIKLLIGFLVITGMSMVLTSGTQLAKADIHEGTGSMLGLADCSTCLPGGSSCIGLVGTADDCWEEPGGLFNCLSYICMYGCPTTRGVVCTYTGSPGSCSDGAESCGTVKRWRCIGWNEFCICTPIPWITEPCGTRNTCL